jgi:site-specific DNA-cytosine methylase
LFRDVRELKDDQAHTAYGTLVDVAAEGTVDVLIAGTSCVDFSNLNTKKARLSRTYCQMMVRDLLP